MPAATASALVPALRSHHRRVWTMVMVAGALLAVARIASADDQAPPAKTAGGNSVVDGFRSLGQQISDPKTLDRIKGHEQDFEKNVQSTRDEQRKSHPGELRASDATGMANDPRMGGKTGSKTGSKTGGKPSGKPSAQGTAPAAARPKTAGEGASKDAAAPRTPAGAGEPPKAPPPSAGAPAKAPGR